MYRKCPPIRCPPSCIDKELSGVLGKIGDKVLAWVHKASCNDTSFSICSVETLRDVRNDWLQSNESAMIVRFISATDMTDGHTIFSCKDGGKVWTFQAYLNGCSLQFREYDIFNVTDVIKKNYEWGTCDYN